MAAVGPVPRSCRHFCAQLSRCSLPSVRGLQRERSADVTHTVARGHTLDAIAHRYHVTVKAIVDANHLKIRIT